MVCVKVRTGPLRRGWPSSRRDGLLVAIFFTVVALGSHKKFDIQPLIAQRAREGSSAVRRCRLGQGGGENPGCRRSTFTITSNRAREIPAETQFSALGMTTTSQFGVCHRLLVGHLGNNYATQRIIRRRLPPVAGGSPLLEARPHAADTVAAARLYHRLPYALSSERPD